MEAFDDLEPAEVLETVLRLLLFRPLDDIAVALKDHLWKNVEPKIREPMLFELMETHRQSRKELEERILSETGHRVTDDDYIEFMSEGWVDLKSAFEIDFRSNIWSAIEADVIRNAQRNYLFELGYSIEEVERLMHKYKTGSYPTAQSSVKRVA
jgi:hypothetical protein